MAAFIFTIGDFHLVSATKIITTAYPYWGWENNVDTRYQVIDEAIIPMIKVDKGGREAEGRVWETLAHTQLHVDGHTLKVVVISF